MKPRTVLGFQIGAIHQKLHKNTYKLYYKNRPPLYVQGTKSSVAGNLSDYVRSQIEVYNHTRPRLHVLYFSSSVGGDFTQGCVCVGVCVCKGLNSRQKHVRSFMFTAIFNLFSRLIFFHFLVLNVIFGKKIEILY